MTWHDTIFHKLWQRRSILMAIVIAIALVCAYALLFGGYLVSIVGFAAIYTIFVCGLNFFMGYTGQVSFGQNSFAAIGGYASAVLTAEHGWAPFPSLLVGATGAAAAAVAIGYPTLRLRGHHLAMATMALGLITYEISIEWQSVTKGYMGITGIPPMGLLGFELTSDRQQMVLLLLVALGSLWVTHRLTQSRFGRALASVAGDEQAAQSIGVDVLKYKIAAFVFSALLASIAGSLFAHFVGFISPEVFGLNMVVLGFTMLYVGGIGSLAGPLVGAFIVGLLPETLRQFKDFQDLVYGAALILLLIYAPRGLASASKRRDRKARPASAVASAP